MKDEYDFSNARRGPVIAPGAGMTRITIRIDDDVLQWFRNEVERRGGGNYQTMINAVLRQFVATESQSIEDVVRRVIREELHTGHLERTMLITRHRGLGDDLEGATFGKIVAAHV